MSAGPDLLLLWCFFSSGYWITTASTHTFTLFPLTSRRRPRTMKTSHTASTTLVSKDQHTGRGSKCHSYVLFYSDVVLRLAVAS